MSLHVNKIFVKGPEGLGIHTASSLVWLTAQTPNFIATTSLKCPSCYMLLFLIFIFQLTSR